MKRLLPVLVLLASCGGKTTDSGSAPATRYPVETALAVSEAAARAITAPGSLEARETARISARVAGVIDRILIRDGETVKRGQSVAEIDAERYRLAAVSARAQVARAKAGRDDTAASQARRERAAREQPGLVSDEELAQVRARTQQAEADVAISEAALARAELDLADARVVSPVDGVVQARLASTGDPMQPGSPIASIVDRSEVLLRFSVPLGDATRLQAGQAVAFRTPADGEYRGARVRLVSEAADPVSRQVTVLAVVDDAAGVRPGSFASVRCDLPAGPARVLVPEQAVHPSERGWLVWLAVEGKARERQVQVGARTRDNRIEVLSGLQAGETVVLRGGDALRDGVPLDIAKPAP